MIAIPSPEAERRVPSFLHKVGVILWKDLLAEYRTKELLSSMLVFALLVVVIFNFAFELRVENTLAIAPGVLWVAFTFAGVLGLNRSLVMEKDKGCLDGLLLCPVDRGSLYVGKMVGNLIFMSVMEAIALPIFSMLFNLPIFLPNLLLVTFLGTVGFAGVGTLFSAMAVNTRTREVMLPVLLFPIVVPVIISAVKLTGLVLEGGPLTEGLNWLNLLVIYDVVFVVVSFLAFEYVLEE